MNDKKALRAIQNTMDRRRMGYNGETECIRVISDILESHRTSSKTTPQIKSYDEVREIFKSQFPTIANLVEGVGPFTWFIMGFRAAEKSSETTEKKDG